MKNFSIKQKSYRVILGILLGLVFGISIALLLETPALGIGIALAIAIACILPVFVKNRKETANN